MNCNPQIMERELYCVKMILCSYMAPSLKRKLCSCHNLRVIYSSLRLIKKKIQGNSKNHKT